MHICPVCGGDQEKDLSELKKELNSIRIVSEHVNPGGRELIITGSMKYETERIQLSDMCNSCDEKKLIKFMNEASR